MLGRPKALQLALALALLTPALAQARILRVAYRHAGARSGVTREGAIRAIQQAAREWELHSSGQILTRWDGLVSTYWSEDDLILFRWDDLGSGICAQTCRYGNVWCDTFGSGSGNIVLNTNSAVGTLNPFGEPTAGSSCGDLTSTLLHEMAHLFRDTGTRFTASVLDVTIPDLAVRHLWESDRSISRSLFPVGTLGFRFDGMDPTTRGMPVTQDEPIPPDVRTPIAVATGDGSATYRNFALAWGSSEYPDVKGIQLYRGDISRWDSTFFWEDLSPSSPNFERRTSRRPCVAVSASGLDYYLVWASANQAPSVAGSAWSGSRAVWAMESHDRGDTWSDPLQIPGAYTRNGLSCSLDRSRERVVVAYEGSGEEGLWVFHRAAQVAGSAQWSAPQRVFGAGFVPSLPVTRDIPYLAFDFFGTQPGRLAWMDDRSYEVLTATFGWNGSTYELLDPAVARVDPSGWPYPSRDTLRTEPVLSFEGEPMFHGVSTITRPSARSGSGISRSAALPPRSSRTRRSLRPPRCV